MSAPRTPWEIVGVRRGASIEEVNAAFRKRARELHPDLAKSADDRTRRTRAFSALSDARETLTDPVRRQKQLDAEARASAPAAAPRPSRPAAAPSRPAATPSRPPAGGAGQTGWQWSPEEDAERYANIARAAYEELLARQARQRAAREVVRRRVPLRPSAGSILSWLLRDSVGQWVGLFLGVAAGGLWITAGGRLLEYFAIIGLVIVLQAAAVGYDGSPIAAGAGLGAKIMRFIGRALSEPFRDQ